MSLSSGEASSSSGRSSTSHAQPPPPQDQGHGYYATRHPPVIFDNIVDFRNVPPEGNFGVSASSQNERNVGFSMENGAINLHIPCAFSYAYDVPVPPQRDLQIPQQPSKTSVNRRKGTIPAKPSISTTSKKSEGSRSNPSVKSVKSGELFKAKQLPSGGAPSKSENNTRVIYDMEPAHKISYCVVSYGQELYEEAAKNLARELHEEELAEKAKEEESSPINTGRFKECNDLSRPAFNSSKYTTKALERAMESLKTLPEDMELLLRKDKRFEPIVLSKATKSLNRSRNSKVFKDLIPVDPNPDVWTEAENYVQAEIKRSIEAARQPSRTKDPEPKLEDFQKNSYTRIRPVSVRTPSKPTSGVSVESNYDFDTIEEEKRMGDESNRL